MSNCGCGAEQADTLEKKTLIILLLINGLMFLFEAMSGWYADSTGLISDSLDMLADAMVYGISLYAVGKKATKKIIAAKYSGYFQITLGVGVLLEVTRRILYGSEPLSYFIIIIGFIALIANLICLVLISKHRGSGVHMRASWIFSTNDVIANIGVVIAGILVRMLNSNIPDLIIGTIIAIVVIRGGLLILRETAYENSNCEENV